MRYLFACVLFLVVACAAPRVSTVDERMVAMTTLSAIDTAIVLAAAKGKLTPQEVSLATAQTNELRQLVVSSISHPVHWTDLYHRVVNLAIQWMVVGMGPDDEASSPDGQEGT